MIDKNYARLIRAAQHASSEAEFLRQVAQGGSWYLRTPFLRDQKIPYFQQIFRQVKGL